MIDQNAVTQLVEKTIAESVSARVTEFFANDQWFEPTEQKIIKYTQDRILGKFNNSSAIPELVEAIKVSVAELFAQGQIPGIEKFVDTVAIQQAIDQAVETTVDIYITELANDAGWLEKIQRTTNYLMTQKTLDQLSTLDVASVIRQQVSESLTTLEPAIVEKLRTAGIDDQATATELEISNGSVIVKSNLVTSTAEIVDGLRVKNLAVTGSINVDNASWQTLSENISQKTLEKLSDQWRDQLVQDVAAQIKQHGISFDDVTVDGRPLISGDQLNSSICHSRLQSVGELKDLWVKGEAHINNTLNVVKHRIGINTADPQSALSVWDEEVSVNIGKFKNNTAYIGTNKAQGINIQVNRQPAIEIDADAMTTIKNLRLGIHKISFASELPNYAGSKGEFVFNSNPSVNDTVFAWVCLGGHKWKVLRSA
jgi:hypothetical protein